MHREKFGFKGLSKIFEIKPLGDSRGLRQLFAITLRGQPRRRLLKGKIKSTIALVAFMTIAGAGTPANAQPISPAECSFSACISDALATFARCKDPFGRAGESNTTTASSPIGASCTAQLRQDTTTCGWNEFVCGTQKFAIQTPQFITNTYGNVDYWPRFAPDGRTVLFTRCANDPSCTVDGTAGPFALYTIPARGGTPEPLYLPPSGDAATRPDWSWNRSLKSAQIAFELTGSVETFSQLWLLNSDGSSPQMVSTPAGKASYPSFFPRGNEVSIEVPDKPGPFLQFIGLPAGNLIATQNLLWTGESSVSRDGKMLALAAQEPVMGGTYNDSNNMIWIENANGSDLRMLDGIEGRTPNWSPHDTLVEFESTRNCTNGNYAIFVEPPTGGNALQITSCAFNANHAVWSPDGREFAVAVELPNTGNLNQGGWWGIAILRVPFGLVP